MFVDFVLGKENESHATTMLATKTIDGAKGGLHFDKHWSLNDRRLSSDCSASPALRRLPARRLVQALEDGEFIA